MVEAGRVEPGRAGSVGRTLRILEVVAAGEGATAKEIAVAAGIPLPTVYRLARELLDGGYLVHIKDDKRFELGYKLHQLGVSLHQQLGVSREVRAQVSELHNTLGTAAYLALHRGAQIVVVQTADCPRHPRLGPLAFGYHEAPHAHALGKILLANMDPDERSGHLTTPLLPVTADTITDPDELTRQLDEVAARGVAWEYGEFQTGATCAAAAIRGGNGLLLGSVAISAPDAVLAGRTEEVEAAVRTTASRISRYYRQGQIT